ncbi:MAG: glycosyltransferase family 2 protein [Ferruginibacter sp.]
MIIDDSPLISICIPAYQRTEFLKRLFDSISIQTFKNYEVVVTDDSADDSVQNFVSNYSSNNNVYYFRNKTNLGTPENWNEAIRKANGKWIKLMHDDDWFANESSLEQFYEAIKENERCLFFFSAYNNVEENSSLKSPVYLTWLGDFLLKRSPLNLFKKQFIGNPSCTLIRRDINLFYDKNFKWVVDFEYYIRCLYKIKKYYYINSTLINVGLSESQVTKYTFRVADVEIPENHLLIEKMGTQILRNIFVYDYFWRLYRNLEIRSQDDILKIYKKPLDPLLKRMINFQMKISTAILRIGIFSKLFMFRCYVLSFFTKAK